MRIEVAALLASTAVTIGRSSDPMVGSNGGLARSLARILKVTACLFPTILAAIYYLGVAADQYESDVHFIVRSAKGAPETSGGLIALAQVGIGHAQDDTFAINDFFLSRNAVSQLQNCMPLRDLFNRPEGDALARYPSILFGASDEEFFKYFKRMVSVVYTSTTGITTLTVRAFRPTDARQILENLLALGEQFINRMNDRLQEDAIKSSVAEVALSQERLITSQIALNQFRNSELMVDPSRNAVSLSELIAKLSAELAQATAQMSEMVAAASANPNILALRRRILALEEQIAHERQRINSTSDGLAEKLGEYERLKLRLDFASRMLMTDEADLSKARSEARRQHLFLETIALPTTADYPLRPERWSMIFTVFSINLILLLVMWLVVTGIREHGATGH